MTREGQRSVDHVIGWVRGEPIADDKFFDIGRRFESAESAEFAVSELQAALGAPLMLKYDGVNHILVIGVDDVYRVIGDGGSEFDHINSPYQYIGYYYIAGQAEALDQAVARLARMRRTAEPAERRMMIALGANWPYWNIAVQDLSDHDDEWVFKDPEF